MRADWKETVKNLETLRDQLGSKKVMDDNEAKLFEVPPWAVQYDGTNAPESARFVNPKEWGIKPGDVWHMNGDDWILLFIDGRDGFAFRIE